MPFKVLNGAPGYINVLDAVNAYQLVAEVHAALGMVAAASFKHVSPAGAAVAVPLSDTLKKVYDVDFNASLSDAAVAYIRARNADPMSSFGDFVAISDTVDEEAAMVLKREVSDGIIAPSYTEKAMEILSAKKGGKYIVLQADPSFTPSSVEYREVGGVAFLQRRNDAKFTSDLLKDIKTKKKGLFSKEAERDLVLASITVKYTQSNSVCYAVGGQVIGVGAGQQSRVDCVKLAGKKAETWHLRQHPIVQNLKFKEGVKRQDKVNLRVRYIEGDAEEVEKKQWEEKLDELPEELTREQRREWRQKMSEVALSSDAFFPFRDSIDTASRLGVEYIVQPGGSIMDDSVVEACEEYGIGMCFSNLRLFHH